MVGVVMLGLLALPWAPEAAGAAGTGRTGSVGSGLVTTSTSTSVAGNTAQFGPGQEVGTSFSVTACGFAHGTAVAVAVNGTTAAAMRAEANGCATFGVVVSDPHLTVNGGPAVAIDQGSNHIVSTGTSSSGGTRTDTYTFRVMPTPTATARLATFGGVHDIGEGIDALAVVALGFLVLTFARRRRVNAVPSHLT
jgi:hypothetical protein